MISRELRGRIAGAALFSFFLLYHISFVAKGWHYFDIPSRINSLLITSTIALFLSAYFIRRKAVDYPRGFMETIYPLICAVLPLVIYHDDRVSSYLTGKGGIFETVRSLLSIHQNNILGWNILTMTMVISGNSLTVAGMFYLKRSFSIMAEAREPVFGGLYSYIRHPLYLGEIIATLGVLLFRFSKINVILTVLFVIGQVIRAGLEEEKLIGAFPEYGEYKKRTGKFFPKI